MKRLFLYLLPCLFPFFAVAQTGGPAPYAVQPPVTNGQCLIWSSVKNAYINSSSCGGGGSPAVTTTGSPASGQLAQFSGPSSITGNNTLPSGVLASDGSVLLDATNSVPVSNKDLSSPTNNLGLAPINLQRYGACGITDATTIFNTVATTAVGTGQALYIPGGCTVNHSGTLTLSGLQLLGDGINSILNATDTAATPHSALLIQGTGVVVRGINFKTTWTGSRSAQLYSSAISISIGQTLTNFSIDHNFFTSAFAGSAIQIHDAGTYGAINTNTITGSVLANPIILQSPLSNIDVYDNYIQGGGDNCIEIVDRSHSALSTAVHINVQNNQIATCGAAGVAVLGASYVNVIGNQITSPSGRGIYVASESGFTESPATQINVIGNNIVGSGTADGYILVSGSVGFAVSDVNITANTLSLTTNHPGIWLGACDSCVSPAVTKVNVSKNIVTGDGTNGANGIVLRSGLSDITLEGNELDALQNAAIVTCCSNAGALKITGNHFANLSLASSGVYQAIDLRNSGFASTIITGNDYTAGANSILAFVTCTPPVTPILSANVGAESNCLTATPIAVQSNSLTSVYPSPSPADRTPIMGFHEATPALQSWETAGNQEPKVWFNNGYYNMLYTGSVAPTGSSPSIGYAYATNPAGPWTRCASNPVIGNGAGGTTAGQYVQHTGIYIEGSTLYFISSIGAVGSAILWSAPLNFTPPTCPTFTQLGAIMSLPSGYNAWGNFAIVPITVGSSYALLADMHTNSGTLTYIEALATATGALSGAPAFTLTTYPLTQLASTITYWGTTQGVTVYGAPATYLDGAGNVILYYLAGPTGGAPTDLFRATSPVSDLVNWKAVDNGYPMLRRVQLLETAQAGDPRPVQGPGGNWWMFYTATSALNEQFDVMAVPMYAPSTVSDNGNTENLQKVSDYFQGPTFNPPVYLGTGISAYTAKCRDDIIYNNGVNNLTITAPRADVECFFRVADWNSSGGKTVTLTINGSDFYGGPKTIYAGQLITLKAASQGAWTSDATVGPDAVRVITAAGAVTVVGVSNTAVADRHVCINKTSGAATTVNFPATPFIGLHVTIDDCKGDAATNNITLTPAAGNIDGSGTFVINTNYGSWNGYYTGTIWKTVSSR